ncbi:hypothetical protein P691DRAFT_722734 [Macrolepiota fuliginosa MF-IS2]|uniref:Uncharacterized protein n=1 Tax=Macrolepiota fuliginosa MF-IS2 TaxID=1400762 RepID=A0A9P5XLZ2_9AGAR|nr:hypothetical protein P691DRAFT_722734 [Macrolepiota fuliginosa MF-IS2]
MADMERFNAILFPSDGRPPTVVSLMTSPVPHHGTYGNSTSRIPHPEVYMDYIAEKYGPRAWRYQLIESLDGMNKKFTSPYVVFYPTVSRDGMPFPINKCIRDLQGAAFQEEVAWRGNIVVGKYQGHPFSNLVNASMADYPIVKNYFMTHGCTPEASCSAASFDAINFSPLQ